MDIQGVLKRGLQLRKSIQIYIEVINNILSCHNVARHCEYDAYGTVAPNTAHARAPAVEINMATFTGAERARCVSWFEETKSATQVQRKFSTRYRKESPSRPTIYSRNKNFVGTGRSMLHAKSPGRPCVSDATVEHIWQSFVRRPLKSTRRASREAGVPTVTVWRMLQKRLHLSAYKLSIVQHLTDSQGRIDFQ
jgi:hypothetical protein